MRKNKAIAEVLRIIFGTENNRWRITQTEENSWMMTRVIKSRPVISFPFKRNMAMIIATLREALNIFELKSGTRATVTANYEMPETYSIYDEDTLKVLFDHNNTLQPAPISYTVDLKVTSAVFEKRIMPNLNTRIKSSTETLQDIWFRLNSNLPEYPPSEMTSNEARQMAIDLLYKNQNSWYADEKSKKNMLNKIVISPRQNPNDIVLVCEALVDLIKSFQLNGYMESAISGAVTLSTKKLFLNLLKVEPGIVKKLVHHSVGSELVLDFNLPKDIVDNHILTAPEDIKIAENQSWTEFSIQYHWLIAPNPNTSVSALNVHSIYEYDTDDLEEQGVDAEGQTLELFNTTRFAFHILGNDKPKVPYLKWLQFSDDEKVEKVQTPPLKKVKLPDNFFKAKPVVDPEERRRAIEKSADAGKIKNIENYLKKGNYNLAKNFFNNLKNSSKNLPACLEELMDIISKYDETLQTKVKNTDFYSDLQKLQDEQKTIADNDEKDSSLQITS